MSADIPYYGDGSRTQEIVELFRAVDLKEPAFVNSWRRYAGAGSVEWGSEAGFWRDLFGIVHFQGLIDKAGGAWSSSDIIFTLPRGFRPRTNQIFEVPASQASGGAEGTAQLRIYGLQSANIGIVATGTHGWGVNVGWMSLAGISFLAEHPQ